MVRWPHGQIWPYGHLWPYDHQTICDKSGQVGYPWNSSQSFTTAPIFLLSNYFRLKYLKIASCAVSLLNNIWVRIEHSLLQQKKKLKFSENLRLSLRSDVSRVTSLWDCSTIVSKVMKEMVPNRQTDQQTDNWTYRAVRWQLNIAHVGSFEHSVFAFFFVFVRSAKIK